VDLLLVHGVEALTDTERAQDEFFHLFEALKRRGARVLLAADRAPGGIGEIDERLRSRFEGGLVLEVEEGSGADELTLVESTEEETPAGETPLWDDEEEEGPAPPPAPSTAPDPAAQAAPPAPSAAEEPASVEEPAPTEPAPTSGGWFPSREKVVLHWPELDRLLVEELE